jgi:hypothetical protein
MGLPGGLNHWLTQHDAAAAWLTALGTLGLAAGVAFAWFALRDARQTRHAQLLADFSKRWDDSEILRAVNLARDYGPQGLVALTNKLFGTEAPIPPDPDNVADWDDALKWPNLLETIGVMVKEGALPKTMVFGMWGGPIVNAWRNHWEDATFAHRRQKNDADIFIYFEWLAGEMERERARGRAI